MSDRSDNPADFEFDYLAAAMLAGGWGEADFVLGYDESTRVYLVEAKHHSGVRVEGALHAGLLYFGASGLVHDLSRKLRDELTRRGET